MPVRDKAVMFITERIVGAFTAPGLRARAPRGVKKEHWDVVQLAADQAYEHVVLSIDWNRVYIDAQARHLSLHKDEPEEPIRLVEPSDEALAAAADDDRDEAPPAPRPAWMMYREDDVCPECIMEAVLANEWGGKSADKWRDHPTAPRWRSSERQRRHPELAVMVMRIIGWGWAKPQTAKPGELDDDGHMPTCYEVGRPPDHRMICDPRCPQYEDGWAEMAAGEMADL